MRHSHRFPAARGLTLALAAAALVLGCGAASSGHATPTTSGSPSSAAADPAASQSGKTAAALGFDGERALMYTRDVVAFGPRPVGSAELEQTRKYIESTLAGFGLTTRRDEFVGNTPVGDIEMANIIAEVPAAEGAPDGPVIILSGHYDTLKTEGFDFLGANDGGSSTGVLLELGRVLAEHRPPLPVWLVFFDGEEALVAWSETDSRYGSKHMATRMEEAGELDTIGAMILMDMIGDAELAFPRDDNGADWLNDIVWQTAADIGYGDVFVSGVQFMEDDHLPFTRRGVAAIDLIDFSYGPGSAGSGGRNWHSPFDTMDKLGAGSFQAIGETVLSALPRIAEHLQGQ
ncbi:MAG: M28 family peptidase [Acidobacteriota bacterium]|jgi:hypothetical protein